MKNIRLYFVIIFGISVITFGNAQITNKYKRLIKAENFSYNEKEDAVKIELEIQKGSPPKSTKKRKTLFDLSEKGQKALIEAYNKPAVSNDDLRKALIESLDKTSSKKTNSLIVENFKFYIKLDFYIEDKWFEKNPSNRISSLKLTFTLPNDSPFKIDGFKGFQTQYETIALGDVSNTSTRNFSLTAGTGISSSNTSNSFNEEGLQTNTSVNGLTPSVSATAGVSNSRTENLTLSRRIISQTGTTSDNKMIVYLEGAPDRNLNGIVSVELELEAKELVRDRLDIFNYSINKKTKSAVLTPKFLFYTNIDAVLKGDYNYEWVYRKIRRKGKSNIEGKHVISYNSHKSIAKSKDFLKTGDINIPYYSIQYNTREGGKDTYENIYLTRGEESHLANFLSKADAIQFRWHLLQLKTDKVDSFNLSYLKDNKFVNLKTSDFIRLKVKDRSTLEDYKNRQKGLAKKN